MSIIHVNKLRDMLHPIFEANPVYSATLFGSYAKENATEQSDVDIVIDSRGQLLNMAFYGILDEITERLDKSADLFEMSEIRNPSAVYTSIQKEMASWFLPVMPLNR